MSALQQLEYPLHDRDFAEIARRVRDVSGIVLNERKRELVYNRLVRRLRALNLSSFGEYCDLLNGAGGQAETKALINAITTNLTAFFREPHHFEHLAHHVLQPLVQAHKGRTGRIRLWSSACSTGEEPYSIGMVMAQAVKGERGIDAKILATDIDSNVLEQARAATYPEESFRAIPEPLRKAYVQRAESGNAAIAPEIRERIAFKQLNLQGDWPMRGPFDAIFCRNVFIYFDKRDQARIAERFGDLLPPGGWLYIGHSESLQGTCDRFEMAGRTTYRKVR